MSPNGTHIEPQRGVEFLVDVERKHAGDARKFCDSGHEFGGETQAGAAPCSPELDKDGQLRLQHVFVERIRVDRLRLPWEMQKKSRLFARIINFHF